MNMDKDHEVKEQDCCDMCHQRAGCNSSCWFSNRRKNHVFFIGPARVCICRACLRRHPKTVIENVIQTVADMARVGRLL